MSAGFSVKKFALKKIISQMKTGYIVLFVLSGVVKSVQPTKAVIILFVVT